MEDISVPLPDLNDRDQSDIQSPELLSAPPGSLTGLAKEPTLHLDAPTSLPSPQKPNDLFSVHTLDFECYEEPIDVPHLDQFEEYIVTHLAAFDDCNLDISSFNTTDSFPSTIPDVSCYYPGYHCPPGSTSYESQSGYGTISLSSESLYQPILELNKANVHRQDRHVFSRSDSGQLTRKLSRSLAGLSIQDVAVSGPSIPATKACSSITDVSIARKSMRFAPYKVPPRRRPASVNGITRSEASRPLENALDLQWTTYDVTRLLPILGGPCRNEITSQLRTLRGLAAVNFLDSLQSWLDENPHHEHRRKAIKAMIDVATASKELPKALFLPGVMLQSSHAARFGGCADVFCGTVDGQTVALKRLRFHEQGKVRRRIYEKLCREGLIWRQLVHPNVLPFLGVDAESFRDIHALAMVSPWMDHGCIMDYVCSSEYDPRAQRFGLIFEIAEGLEYLHGQGIAHGDLHGSNVFITADGRPCLADFGLANISSTSSSRATIFTVTTTTTTSSEVAGAIRWLAPEYLTGDNTSSPRTPAGDVFAFGRICLAVCTTRQPFHGTPDVPLLFLVLKGEHPPRPDESDCGGFPMPDELWRVVNECWAQKPADRPDMPNVLRSLRTMMDEHV